MVFKVRCIFNQSNSTDMGNIAKILDMVRTDGYKLMYYHYTSGANNSHANAQQSLYQVATNAAFGHQFTAGEVTAYTLSYQYYHLHVLFNDFQLKQIGDNGSVMYDLTGIVLPVPTSTTTPSA